MIFAKVVEANGFSEAARRLKCRRRPSAAALPTSRINFGVRRSNVRREASAHDVGSEVLGACTAHHRTERSGDTSLQTNLSNVSGVLRLAAPPSISDRCLRRWSRIPASYPNVRVQVFITDRIVDQIAEGLDLVFKIGEQLKDSSLVARRILT